MSKKLFIVESPGKIQKIQKILGNEYIVAASVGHIRMLDPKNMSIDIQNNFTPKFIIDPDKKKVINNLLNLKKQCNEVIIATDDDREGKAIGQSLIDILKLKDKKLCTVRVLKEYEKKTYGIKIIEDSLKILNCDKPNCTVSEDLLHSFSRPFINLFKFDITKVWNGIYQKGKLEYEFNGTTNLKNKTIY